MDELDRYTIMERSRCLLKPLLAFDNTISVSRVVSVRTPDVAQADEERNIHQHLPKMDAPMTQHELRAWHGACRYTRSISAPSSDTFRADHHFNPSNDRGTSEIPRKDDIPRLAYKNVVAATVCTPHTPHHNMSKFQEGKAPPLTTVANFRDVASLVQNINPGLLYRSANLGKCCPQHRCAKATTDHVSQTMQVEKTLTFFVNNIG